MKKSQKAAVLSVLIFIALVVIKIFIKQRLELQLVGLVILIGISWSIKYVIFKKINNHSKTNDENIK